MSHWPIYCASITIAGDEIAANLTRYGSENPTFPHKSLPPGKSYKVRRSLLLTLLLCCPYLYRCACCGCLPVCGRQVVISADPKTHVILLSKGCWSYSGQQQKILADIEPLFLKYGVDLVRKIPAVDSFKKYSLQLILK